MVISLTSFPRLCGRPSALGVKIVVVVVVAVVTAVMGGLGYSPGTALGVIVMVTTTALELGRRITADSDRGDGADGDSGFRDDGVRSDRTGR